jgi:hypothetical protein
VERSHGPAKDPSLEFTTPGAFSSQAVENHLPEFDRNHSRKYFVASQPADLSRLCAKSGGAPNMDIELILGI